LITFSIDVEPFILIVPERFPEVPALEALAWELLGEADELVESAPGIDVPQPVKPVTNVPIKIIDVIILFIIYLLL
jgi:hypothetical protein